jgi:hypothetical protein
MGLCDFASAGFGNNVKYQLNDAYVGPDTSSGVGKLAVNLVVFALKYRLSTTQSAIENTLSKTLFQPQWDIDYRVQ